MENSKQNIINDVTYFSVILEYIKKYPNDMELGKKVRELINSGKEKGIIKD